MNAKEILRVASLGAILLASSCAAPTNTIGGLVHDPAKNHPILVDPDYRSLQLPFAAAEAGLLPDDNTRFTDFVGAYLDQGSGSIAIAVAPNANGDAAIRYFGERMADLGVPRDRILITRRQDATNPRVELNYVAYKARVANCGNWSVNMGTTANNMLMPNTGCANQQNIAAMVADPRDLISPRGMEDRDNRRRAVVFDNYAKGEPTGASKAEEQSADLSNVDQ